MKKRVLAAAMLIAAMHAAPALARDEYGAVSDKEVVNLDPAKSYLIVQTSSDSSMFSFPVTLIRRAEPEEVADYLARRATALAKARGKWERKHAQWQDDMKTWNKLSPKDQALLKAKRPTEPNEPTDASLPFPALDMENMVTIGPFKRFAKTNGRSTFVQSVKPGRYVFYGPVFNAQAIGGTCMCMGSIEFEVKPRQIVHAGMMRINLLDARSAAKAAKTVVPKNDFDLPQDMTSIGWEAPVQGASIDPRLNAFAVIPAELHAAGRIPNYAGIQIDRLTPIPGVLAYDRERVFDVKTGTTVSSTASASASSK